MGQLCCDCLGQPPLAPGQTGKEALAPAKANGKAAPAPAGTEAAVLLALGRIEEQMGRLEKQQALLLEAQEGHYEDVEELEGTVEQAIEEGTSVLDNLEAGSQQARSTMENVFAVAKAARDTGLVLLGFGGLGLLLWTLSWKGKALVDAPAKASSPTPEEESDPVPAKSPSTAPTPAQAPAKVGLRKMG